GNALANTITGGACHDTLNGGAGADMMIGGAGDYTYIIDNAGDSVAENAASGTDTVKTVRISSVPALANSVTMSLALSTT
ncbi:calcium-binding protein, partial [Rhizobium leguminosarum]